jgi:Zn-dependent protease
MDESPRRAVPPPLTGNPPPELPPMRYGPPKRSIGDTLKKLLGPFAIIFIVGFKWLAKLKFVIPALIKFFPVALKTGGSMILTIGVYTLVYGWWFALGFVLLIFVHECGHLVAARRLGLKVGAPVFIPFMGAFIALKEAPKNAWIEAQVGIGGPLLGAAGALACYGIYLATGEPIFRALTYVGFFLNLFNLAPIGFLDGGRIVTALSPWLWIVGTGAVVAMMFHHFNPLLLLILIMSLPRLFSLFRKRTDEEKRYFEVPAGKRAIMAVLYFGLAASLALGMKLIIDAEELARQ